MNSTRSNKEGRVITFYSFKGGSGRTMSLANVAVLLARTGMGTSGNRVLVMDWDLEAPGLHEFFKDQMATEDLAEKPGVIDLFLEAEKKFPNGMADDKDMEQAAKFIRTFFKNAAIRLNLYEDLWLMKAGRFGDNYSISVQTFDWRSFFDKSYQFFILLIDFLENEFHFTLIDSRTGLTDVGGICTSILPEALVTVFTPTRQGLRVAEVAERAVVYRRRTNDLRPLIIYPLASRIDTSAEDLNRKWKQDYTQRFEELFAQTYNLDGCDLKRYFGKVEVHYVTNYSYGESVAVLEHSNIMDTHELPAKYNELVQLIIGEYLPWEMPDMQEPRLVSAPDHINFANMLAINKEFKRAERHFYRAIELEPQNSSAYRSFIDYLENRKEWEKAETVFGDWLSRMRDFKSDSYWLDLSLFISFLIKRDRLEKAKSLAEDYLKNDNTKVLISLNYAHILAKMSQVQEAEMIYQRLLKEQPDNDSIIQQYADFLRFDKKDYPAAEKLLRGLAENSTEPESYQAIIAQLLLLQRKQTEAETIIKQLLSQESIYDYTRWMLLFLRMVYFPEHFKTASQELDRLIENDIYLPVRNFEADLEAAEKNSHPFLKELREITAKITMKEEEEVTA